MSANRTKGYKGLPLEGLSARWYARITKKDIGQFQKLAANVAGEVPAGGGILEVAPGPGYLAIELARLGRYRVTGLDISRTFVEMASENAKKAGIEVVFLHGDAAAMPFEAGSFNFIVCRAAFKNFSSPVEALCEMHRVLQPGGKALILDLRSDASTDAIAAHIKSMGVGWINAVLMKWIFKCMLLKRAYSQEQFRQMALESPFGGCEIRTDAIGMEAWLRK